MDKVYGLTQSRNSEVRFRWYTLAIKHGYDTVYPNVVSFLKEQGRMKFVRPLFRDLFRAEGVAKQIALDTFSQHREAYHPIGTSLSLSLRLLLSSSSILRVVRLSSHSVQDDRQGPGTRRLNRREGPKTAFK
jgi:hypothetical protein